MPWSWPNQYSWWNTADSLLPKEFIHESRLQNTEEWFTESRRIRTYQLSGLISKERFFRPDENGILVLNYEEEFKYDRSGNQIYHLRRDLLRETERIEEYVYDAQGRVLEIRESKKYFTDNMEWEIVITYEYDSQGRLILSQTIYDETNYGGGINGSRCETTASGEGCDIIMTQICYSLNSGDWISRYKGERTGEESCGTTISNDFRFINGQWSYDYGEKMEREFDQLGNVIKFESYNRNSGEEDWVWQFESVFEFDDKGNIVFYTYKNPSLDQMISVHQEYDLQNRPVSILEEWSDPINEDLRYRKEQDFDYDLNGNLVLEEVRYHWDSIPGGNSYDFNGYEYAIAEFDDDNNLIRIEEYESSSEYFYDNGGAYQFEESSLKFETLYKYRCDHVLTELTKTVLEADNHWYWQEGSQERYILEYFLRPECYDSQTSEGAVLSLFPNPATNYVHIYYPEYLGLTQIRIMDGMGRIVFEDQKELSNYFSVDLSMILDGMYILNLDNGKINQSRKIAIQK